MKAIVAWCTLVLFVLVSFRGGYLLLNGLSLSETYQNLANPYLRIVHVTPGLRKEQIVDIFAETLAWNDQNRKDFEANVEGYYFPATYLVPVYASGKEVGAKMVAKFHEEVQPPVLKKGKNVINEDTAVKIASIIQREAAGPADMNLISGIIWNRIFQGMSLDMDATLQYAKGNDQNGWWPTVVPADKKINSPYNTYKNEGLPPTPISNPGLSAIAAAYNPTTTDCIFYFHDKNRVIHCSKTYEDHVAKIKQYL